MDSLSAMINTTGNSQARTPDQQVPDLLTLPNETLTQIASYLGVGRCTTSLMRTCRRLSGVGEFLRYTSIVVAGDVGKNLMVTLSSGTPTSRRYCEQVSRLWYKGWDTPETEDRTFAAYLFTTTLPLLPNLRTLLVESPSFETEYLHKRMVASGLARSSQHPSLSILDGSNRTGRMSVFALGSLQHMRLSAPAHVLSLAVHRPLVNLDITVILDKASFGMLISEADNSILGKTLTTLSMKFAGVLHVAIAFPLIARAFSNLRHLSLEQTDMDIRVVLGFLDSDQMVLPDLRVMAMNRKGFSPRGGVAPPSRWLDKSPLDYEMVEGMVSHIFSKRPKLTNLCVTKTVWEVGPYGGVRGKGRWDNAWLQCFDQPFLSYRFS